MAGLLSAVEQDTTLEAWEPLSWGLPGQGEPAEDCGKYRPRWVCAGERVVWLCRRECRRRECPYCYLAWARGEARIAARRILLHPTGGIATRHGIVSTAPGWAPTAAEYDTARRQMYLSLRAEGWTGYCVVYHPYRGRDTGEARKCYDVPGGHWHVTGWKEIGPTTPQFPPGWFYQNDEIRQGASDHDRLVSTLEYELDHAGVRQDRHSIIWVGGLSYRKIPKDEDEPRGAPPSCPTCKEPLMEADWRIEVAGGLAYFPRDCDGVVVTMPVAEWPGA